MQAYRTNGESGVPVPYGDPVAPGDTITNFRAEEAFFVKVAREPEGNSTGRIAYIKPGKNWPRDEEPTYEALMEDQRVNSWPEQLSWYQEVFPSVYGLEIR